MDNCSYCTKRGTVECRESCNTYKIQQATTQLQKEINGVKNKRVYRIFINEKYYDDVVSRVKFKGIKYIKTSVLEDVEVCCLIDMTPFGYC